MNKKNLWHGMIVLTAIVVLGVGISGAWLERQAFAQAINENNPATRSFTAVTSSNINYQGRVTNADGAPLSGTYAMRFQLYDAAVAGTLLWDSGSTNITVANGLFNAELAVDANAFTGQALWLRLHVAGEWLSPLQEILPTPYALSLRPGADISGEPETANGSIIDVELSGFWPSAQAGSFHAPATGTAIFADANGGTGIFSDSDNNYAIWGHSQNSWAGYFDTENGYGIRVNSDGTDHYDHGAYITSSGGYGLYAQSSNNQGVRGEAGNVSGLSQPLGPVGVVGIGSNRGVYGSSGSGIGIYGTSDSQYGLWGQSDTYRGVTGRTSRSDNNYGFYTPDNIYSLNYNLTGAIMQVVQNGGDDAIMPGDVVVFSGIGDTLFDSGLPTIQVSHSTTANNSAVAGVVYSRFNIAAIDPAYERPDGSVAPEALETTSDGPVLPGEYMLLVVQGPAEVNVSAARGSIRPGDLLTTNNSSGLAALASEVSENGVDTAVSGAVFGKSLESLEAGQDTIFVFVTLH